MSQRYQILHYTLCGGWVNTWTEDDGVPETFASYDEALAEIDTFFAEIAEQIATGERDPDNGYSVDEFMIAPVGQEVPS